ncbi:MAG: hypothetical protein NZ578_17985, partial [Candidatus Binatia bacterium]|nr:hypothetical protein [Candidatus Binatia bacterium]
FGGDHFGKILGELKRFVGAEALFACIDDRFCCDPSPRKKLLRLVAGHSARTVVIPVDRLRHICS